MIQLATEPTASRISYRRAQGQEQPKAASSDRRGRTGHAWPFPSRYATQPADPNGRKTAGMDSGS